MTPLGAFSCEVPLKKGTNQLAVVARDKAGNTAEHSITVNLVIPATPLLTIMSPSNNSVVTGDSITVSGYVKSSLKPQDIRIVMGGDIRFPTGSEESGEYNFSFENVRLKEGDNHLLVSAESSAGNVSKEVMVQYDPGTRRGNAGPQSASQAHTKQK